MTTRSISGEAAAQFISPDGAEERLLALRDTYGEGRSPDAASLLRQIERLMADGAGREDQADSVVAALRKAFGERGVEGAALRSDIETLVEGGEMRPSAAESWAKTFGWPQFAGWADPAKFDPMAEEFWTLPMTAAWIRWHNLDRSGEANLDDETGKDATEDYWRKRDHARAVEQVRRHAPEYIAASTRWVEVSHFVLDDQHQPLPDGDAASPASERTKRGYIVAPREDHGWSDLPGETTETRRILREALKSKLLQAERYYDEAFKLIPEDEWSALRIVGFRNDDGVYSVNAPDGTEYLAVRVPREDVLKLFPEPAAGDEAPALRPVSIAIAKQILANEANARDGKILGKRAAERYLRDEHHYRGRDNIYAAVDELTGGREPGER